MVYMRKAEERGKVNLGWLNSNHSFSFGHYYDVNHMGFSVLRVINDDVVQPGRGFDTHGHKDMEIVSYVVKGALKHKDSAGNEYQVPAGDIQVMSAGRGIMHSEYNASDTEEVNFLQIWILPNQKGGAPTYGQRALAPRGETNPLSSRTLTPDMSLPRTTEAYQDEHGANANVAARQRQLLVSADGRQGSLPIKQDASISSIHLSDGEQFTLHTGPRKGYLHIVRGTLKANIKSELQGISLRQGDGLGIYMNDRLQLDSQGEALALWFDLPNI